MANIFRYEADINACNRKLLERLEKHAENAQPVKIASLIAAYAYDVLFATTTGQTAGFLDEPSDTAKVTAAVSGWKLHAVLNASYLRFFPCISQLAKSLLSQTDGASTMLNKLRNGLNNSKGNAMGALLGADGESDNTAERSFDARVAMLIAGSDPTITHILTSLFYIYRDHELLERLRQEICYSGIGNNPSFKNLIHSRPRMPLLHAVLQESLRLHQPHTSGFSQVTPPGGIMIGDEHVPEDVSLHCLLTSETRFVESTRQASACAYHPHYITTSTASHPTHGRILHIATILLILIVWYTDHDLHTQCTICLEPAIAHVNPAIFGDDAEIWNPHRWLQGRGAVRRMRSHMLAVRAPTQPPSFRQ